MGWNTGPGRMWFDRFTMHRLVFTSRLSCEIWRQFATVGKFSSKRAHVFGFFFVMVDDRFFFGLIVKCKLAD